MLLGAFQVQLGNSMTLILISRYKWKKNYAASFSSIVQFRTEWNYKENKVTIS